ncbi:uncharacterized protein LOC133823912 [Humulus lupulus]|uniref:uncharacterized protein LOC133823912 n=1 Tax=Humulus lupulus TaxID=3486 RepID=UPI002B4166C7|nr:uncharacterized protein LOC133823912 [Humulus lupulus]
MDVVKKQTALLEGNLASLQANRMMQVSVILSLTWHYFHLYSCSCCFYSEILLLWKGRTSLERTAKAAELEQKMAPLEVGCANLNQELQDMEARVRRGQNKLPEEANQAIQVSNYFGSTIFGQTIKSSKRWCWKAGENRSVRKEENRIATYLTEQGRLVDHFPDVVSYFLDHFRSFMGSPSFATTKINLQCIEMSNKLSVEQQLALLKSFSPKEIRTTFFSIPNNKSLGPDGFGSDFFLALWLDIGGDICRAFGNFFETGHFPAELHNTTISLVPKIDTSARAVDYRPIACCSTIYKCVSKLLCSHLAKALPGLVQQNQGAFVQGIQSSVKVLKATLNGFSSATGLKVNTRKSHIYFGGVAAADRETIAHEIQLTEGSFPLKYLGVPMRPTKWKPEDCGTVIKKIKLRLHNWGSRHLSFAGIIELIHSVFGLRNYWMSIFVLPQSVVKEVEKLCRGFLWGLNGNRSKIHIASLEENSTFWDHKLNSDLSWYWRKLCHLRGKFSQTEVRAAGLTGKFRASKLYNSSVCQHQVDYHQAEVQKMRVQMAAMKRDAEHYSRQEISGLVQFI